MLVALLGIIEFADLLLRQQHALSLDGLGIVPRTASGLVGILFSPLLHAAPAHLAANAVPLLILLTLLFWDRHYHPWLTLAIVWFFSGLGTWLIGRGDSIHIGASSIVFGLVAYLILAGLLMRSWRSVLVAVLVFVTFGGIFYGVLPQPGLISWEGHLCGALAGLLAAKQNHA
jgi:membrane associated rhomboid family serine protease